MRWADWNDRKKKENKAPSGTAAPNDIIIHDGSKVQTSCWMVDALKIGKPGVPKSKRRLDFFKHQRKQWTKPITELHACRPSAWIRPIRVNRAAQRNSTRILHESPRFVARFALCMLTAVFEEVCLASSRVDSRVNALSAHVGYTFSKSREEMIRKELSKKTIRRAED